MLPPSQFPKPFCFYSVFIKSLKQPYRVTLVILLRFRELCDLRKGLGGRMVCRRPRAVQLASRSLLSSRSRFRENALLDAQACCSSCRSAPRNLRRYSVRVILSFHCTASHLLGIQLLRLGALAVPWGGRADLRTPLLHCSPALPPLKPSQPTARGQEPAEELWLRGVKVFQITHADTYTLRVLL